MQERRSRKGEENCLRAEAHVRNGGGAAIKSRILLCQELEILNSLYYNLFSYISEQRLSKPLH